MSLREILGRFIEWCLLYKRKVKWISFSFNKGMEPWKKYPGDAGYDLYISKDAYVGVQQTASLPTNIFVESESPIWFEIKSRSSTLKKYGLLVIEAVIDNGYRGEMFVVVRNISNSPITIERGTRIAQLVPHLVLPCEFVEVNKLSVSDRNQNGFGSTGK